MTPEFTLDSNVIIYASIRKDHCLDIIRLFLREFSNGICFLTPQVKRELNRIQPKLSMLLQILKNYVLNGVSIIDGFNDFLQNKVTPNDRKEFEKFDNIVKYLDQNNISAVNVGAFSSAITSEVGRFLGRDIPIKPTEEDCRIYSKNSRTIEGNIDYLRNERLVIGRGDIRIIAELMFFVTTNSIDFVTDNVNDFNVNNDKWVNHTHLGLIDVLSSDDFYSKVSS